ncbi:MAG: SigE family RNA polymerase sigma factor [Actinomycetota bacterium]
MADEQPPGPRVEGRIREDFDVFFERERKKMIGLAYALSGSGIAAEDLAQEAFVAAYRRWDVVAALDQPEGWVRKVVANNSWSWLRRRKAESRAVVKAVARGGWPTQPSDLPSDSEELWCEVRKLPRRQAQCVALYYVLDLTMPEIAETLGCSKATVNTHLRRAKETLVDRLEPGRET